MSEDWPKDRDVIFNPERKAYHDKQKKKQSKKNCVFCEAAKKGEGIDSLVLHLSEHYMVVLNKYPYHTGHIMLMPVEHIGNMMDLSEKAYCQLQLAIRSSLQVLKETYGAQGLNMGINLGKAAGAGIPDHLHYHLIPRWNGDCNFFPEIAKTRVFSETLEQSFERLQAPLKKALESIR